MIKTYLLIPLMLLSAALLSACGGGSDNAPADVPSVDMHIPDSMTGGKSGSPLAKTKQAGAPLAATTSNSQSQPCAYLGINDDDPFRNGYQTTKFMVSVMATWTCIADTLINVSAYVPHNGVIVETDNDTNAADYEADEPTHYSVSDDSATQTTIRMYYGYDRSHPPVVGEDPQFFVSWNRSDNDSIEGRMVIDGNGVNWEDHQADDPVMMRMDFNYTATTQMADMFLQFDTGNEWADGFRIQMTRNLDANPLNKVFEARGLINMKAQFAPVASISEIPDVQLYAVADGFGNGAAIAEFQDLSLPLLLNASSNNHLGNYLFTKKDLYFFEYDQDWDYIHKTVTSSEYRGDRTTPASGGSWLPFDPSLDLIVSGLALDPAYFTGNLCAQVGDDCNDLLNTIFDYGDGFAGQEPNQGSDPMDWRSIAINSADYLTTVFPNGVDWSNAFDFSFTPGN